MAQIMARNHPIAQPSAERNGLTDSETKHILNHELPTYILKKTVKEGHFSNVEDARIASKEWLKFIVLTLDNPHVRIGMWSDIVDEIWHAYLMYTHEYFAFSRDVLGVDYYHHTPLIIDEDGVSNMPRDKGANFTRLYIEKFGPLHPIWDSMLEMQKCNAECDCCCV